jgi:hypothetical protein
MLADLDVRHREVLGATIIAQLFRCTVEMPRKRWALSEVFGLKNYPQCNYDYTALYPSEK